MRKVFEVLEKFLSVIAIRNESMRMLNPRKRTLFPVPDLPLTTFESKIIIRSTIERTAVAMRKRVDLGMKKIPH